MAWEVLVAPEFQAWLISLPAEGKKGVAVDIEVLRCGRLGLNWAVLRWITSRDPSTRT